MGVLHDYIESELPKICKEAGIEPSEEFISELYRDIIPSTVESVSKTLSATRPKMLRWEKRTLKGFNKRFRKRWKKGLELLITLGVMCRETGEMSIDQARSEEGTPESWNFEALSRLHSRACLYYQEIICLLSGGFADGALARWRSLHEVAIIACHLSESGPTESERFLKHRVVERRKGMKIYNHHAGHLGETPFSQEELQETEEEFDLVIERYGKDFGRLYGWASEGITGKHRNFEVIEKKVGIGHLRPYYKMACERIHASPNGLHSALGLFDREDTLLAGPSVFGLADPAQLAAISLAQATTAFSTKWTNFDIMVACCVCREIQDTISETFISIQEQLEREDRELRNPGGPI